MASSRLEIYQVDSFTSEPFTGNPAGVCITPSGLPEELMRGIAAEMAVSETAFLALDSYRLRWFTPLVEVALCGHGTLATAWVLKERGVVGDGETMTFHSKSGALHASVCDSTIELDFPQARVEARPLDPEKLALLGLPPAQLLFTGIFADKEFVEIVGEEELTALTPDFGGLARLPGRGVVVTARCSRPGVDFVSRYFAPWVGINEDPVTGSAHCALAGYWGGKLNKPSLVGYQASARGGSVGMTLQAGGRVSLFGKAVTTIVGTILAPG
jgi:PhzF family phenazine biosynthesis protein